MNNRRIWALTACGMIAVASAVGVAEPESPRGATPGVPATGAAAEREARLAARRQARMSEEADALFRAADATFLVGDFARAGEMFRRIVSEHGSTPLVVRASARVADCAFEQKKFEEAAALYLKAVGVAQGATLAEEVDAGVRSQYMLGQAHLAGRQYPQAFSALRRFIDRNPSHALANKAYQSIGDAHMALGQHLQALEAYRMVGTILDRRGESHKRVVPGSRLYLRITDADVNVGETPRSVRARLRASSGDVEEIELKPLGVKSGVFVGTIPTALGSARDGGRFVALYSDADLDGLRATLLRVRELEDKSAALSAEAYELERSPAMQADPAGTEAKRNAAQEGAKVSAAEAARLTREACAEMDRKYAAVEGLVAEWSPGLSLEALRSRSVRGATLPATSPATRAAVAVPVAPERGRRGPVEFSPAMSEPVDGGEGAGPAEEVPGEGTVGQSEIDAARMETAGKATTAGNVLKRATLLSSWTRLLKRQFQRIELVGGDTLTVEYLDEIGPGGPNSPAVIRVDRITVASDALVGLYTADGKQGAAEAVRRSSAVLRVTDFDRDVSDGVDRIEVVIAAMPGGAGAGKSEAAAGEEAGPSTRVTIAATQTAEMATRPTTLPLVPANVPTARFTLVETGAHTGVFECVLGLDDGSVASGGVRLEVAANAGLRIAYEDARAIRFPDGWVVVQHVPVVTPSAGTVAAVNFRKSQLDLEASLGRAIASGEVGRIYIELGLSRRGRQYLDAAQADCLEVARAAGTSALGEQALYHSWRIFFYAGLLDEAVSAANTLIARYPKSEYVDDALFQIGQVSLTQGQREADRARAMGQRVGLNRDLSRAIGQLESLARRYPQSPLAPEALYLVAQAHIAAGQTGIEVYERLARQYPDSGFASRGLVSAADHYLQASDYRRAAEFYSRVLVDYPDAPQVGHVLLSRAKCQYKLGQFDDALKALYRVTEEQAGSDVGREAQRLIATIREKRKTGETP